MSDGWGEFPFAEELEHCKKETASITLRMLADDVMKLKEKHEESWADVRQCETCDKVLELIAKRLEEVRGDAKAG